MGTTGIAWPVDAVAGAPSYTGRLAREGIAPLVAGATAARPFGGISGVRPGTANPIAATSTAWTGGLFGGLIDLESSNLSGPYSFMFNVATGGAVVASNAGNPRTDTLSVQISDPAEGDLTTNPLVTLVYNQGFAAASPVDPVTPVPRSFIVARLTFPAGSGTTPTVTWVAPYSVAAGGIGEVNTVAELGVYSYITAPRTGTLVRALDTTITYRYSGSAWKAWESDWIAYTVTTTNITLGTAGTVVGRYRWVGGEVDWDVVVTLGTGGAFGTNPTFSFPSPTPVTLAPLAGTVWLVDATVGSYVGTGIISAGVFRVQYVAATSATGPLVGSGVTASVPFISTVSDRIQLRLTYGV